MIKNAKVINKTIVQTIQELAESMGVSKQTIRYHLRHLPAKDRQIAGKDKQMENLQRLMDQSQQLQLISEKKLLKLEQNGQASHIENKPSLNTFKRKLVDGLFLKLHRV